jgi:hypothetical protein
MSCDIQRAGDEDDLRPEYEFTPEQLKAALRGKYAGRASDRVAIAAAEANAAAESADPAVAQDRRTFAG